MDKKLTLTIDTSFVPEDLSGLSWRQTERLWHQLKQLTYIVRLYQYYAEAYRSGDTDTANNFEKTLHTHATYIPVKYIKLT